MTRVDQLAKVPVLVATGTGGVGKTTLSVAVAIAIANEKDASVLVVTIDPARRLADVLCHEHLGHEPTKVDHGQFTETTPRGELFAAMVDTKVGWQNIVSRYAKSQSDAGRIFQNNLFQNLTTRFSHSHDFVAMDALYGFYRSGKYDYIVLDTPPTSQAFGFFDAPQAMSEFFGGRLVRLVTSPYRLGKGRAAKLFDIASQPFFALANKILGKDFINDIGEFFFLFHSMYDDFADRAKTIAEFLSSERVSSFQVTSPSQFARSDDIDVLDSLRARNISIETTIINSLMFDGPQIESIESELLADNISGPFGAFLKNELALSRAVAGEMRRRNLDDSGPPVTAIARIFEVDEARRLKQLVSSI